MPPNSKLCSFECDSCLYKFKVSAWKLCHLRSIFEVVCVCDFINSDRKCVFIIVLGDRLNWATESYMSVRYKYHSYSLGYQMPRPALQLPDSQPKVIWFDKTYAHECHIPIDRDAFWLFKLKRCIDVKTQIKCKQPGLMPYTFTAAPLYVEWIIHSIRRNNLVTTLM